MADARIYTILTVGRTPADPPEAAGPWLSVVMPALNEAPHVRGALGALQPARHHGAEVLLVDGGSRDATRCQALDLCDRVLRSPPGRARQMQCGAEHARGEVLWFVHADTVVPVDAWRHIAAAVAGGAGWGRFDVRLDSDLLALRVVERLMNLRSRLTRICTGDQAVFVTRSAFDAVGGMPMQPLMEDVELSARLKAHAPMAAIGVPVRTSARRWQRDGVCRTVLLMWALRLGYWLGVRPERLHAWYYR